jgi:aminoglycoside phosphotransferase (APT) family kinase protein
VSESESDLRGIRAENVTRFFRERVEGAQEGPLRFELLSGGRSNLTYLVHGAGGREWVLRRPPLGHVLPTAHDMAREYRVLTALAKTDVPAPRTFALCEDPSVNDYPFYVMQHRPGVVLVDRIPEGFADAPEDRRRICLALIDTLVRLHAVDYESVGLADFGRPQGYLERQVRRWSQQWERSRTDALPEIDELIVRLNRALPESPPPAIVHGDYRLGNMALEPEDCGSVRAVFDWEMATLGDPLADLGYTLIYWRDAADAPDVAAPGSTAAFTALPGFMTRAELIEEYARRSGRSVEAIDFYQALALYKLAIISEGIWARHLQGKTHGKGFEGMTRSSPGLAMRALAIADGSADPRLRG